jgi:O-antigen/teichoic acid export membrane protein
LVNKNFLNKFFEKLSKILGLDAKYFTINSFYTLSSTLLITIYNFFIIVLITNYSSKEIFGQYSYIISIVGIIEIISLPGFKVGTIEATSKGYRNSFVKGTIYRAIASLFIIPTLLIFSFIYISGGFKELSITFLILSFSLPISFPLMNYSYYLIGIKNFKLNFFLSIIESVSIIIIMFITIIKWTNNIIMIIFSRFFTLAVLYIFFWLYTYLKKRKKDEFRDKNFLKYGLYLSGVSLSILTKIKLDRLTPDKYNPYFKKFLFLNSSFFFFLW